MPSKNRFTFTLPPKLREKLEKIAKKKGHKMALVLCDLIRDYSLGKK